MRPVAVLILLLELAWPAPGRGDGVPGVFDYYVLALSWSPAWCAAEGDRKHAPQCAPGQEAGFVLHGLWPQYEDGWPDYCDWRGRAPDPAELAATDALTRSPGLSLYQWRKHGSCSGLDPARYFALARQAWEAVRRPETLRRSAVPLRLDPDRVEGAFLEANPGLTAEAVTVTCRRGLIREVRICLTRALAPRACTGPAARGCGPGTAELLPVR